MLRIWDAFARYVARLFCVRTENGVIQKRLLMEASLTFQKAVEIAVSMETAARESQQLSGSLQEKGGNKCYRCGRTNHNERDCYFKCQLCHNCGNKGHISRVCRNKGKHTTDNVKSKWRKNVQWKKKDSSSDDTTDTVLALHVMTEGAFTPDANEVLHANDLHVKSMQRHDRQSCANGVNSAHYAAR